MKTMYINITISENKADFLVKKLLISLGYSENVEIKRHLLDNDKISYFVYNTINYHGNKIKVLSVLSCTDYMKYLKESLEELGNEICSIYPRLEREKLNYYVSCCQKSREKTYGKRR